MTAPANADYWAAIQSAKDAWRKRQAALPFEEKLKILELLRERDEKYFRKAREECQNEKQRKQE